MKNSFLLKICLGLTLLIITSSFSNNIDLSSLSLDRGFCILGASSGDNFGWSASITKDINSDGVDDIIVSAKLGITTGTTNPGIVYVIFGNKNGFSTIDLANGLNIGQGFQINGVNPGDQFGWSVSGGSDFNGDGLRDIVIGAISTTYTPMSRNNAGTAYMLFGKQSWTQSVIGISGISTPTDGFKVEGSYSSGYFGSSVKIIDDVNGDNINDFLIGAPGENSLSGNVYVIYGPQTGVPVVNLDLPSDLTSNKGFKISGETGYYTGVVVSNAGDFNGDGINDFLIGAPQFPSPGVGKIYVIFGQKGGFVSDIDLSNPISSTQGVVIQGANASEMFGLAVSDAGDFNGDGIADIIVGAEGASPDGRSSSGVVYIFFGSKMGLPNIDLANGLNKAQGFKIEGGQNDKDLGISVGRAGDINGDGIDDVLIGASTTGSGSSIYVIYGRKTGIIDIDLENGLEETAGFKVSMPQSISFALGYAGDVNGDGKSDVIIGTPSTSSIGKACVIYGAGFPGIEILQALSTFQGISTQASQAVALVLTLINFTSPGAVIMTVLAQLLHYMKYMAVTYPPRLQYILDQPDPTFISIPYLSSAPDQVQNSLSDLAQPVNFQKYDILSSFLVNCWSDIITLAIIIVAIIIICLLTYVLRRHRVLHSKLMKVREALKWNYFLSIFIGSFGDISFYTSFEMKASQFSSLLEVVSFLICVLLNTMIIFISIRVGIILYQLAEASKTAKQTRNDTSFKEMQKHFQDYQAVFSEFHSNSFPQQAYLLIFSLRFYLFNCIITYLYEYPLVQAILINIQGLIFILYLIISRPMKDKKDMIGSLAQEVILQVVHICVIGLTIINQTNSSNSRSFATFGDIIIVCNGIFFAIALIYIVFSIVLLIRDLIHAIRRKSSKSKKPKIVLNQRNMKASPSHVPDLRNSNITSDEQSTVMMITDPNRSQDTTPSHKYKHSIQNAEPFDNDDSSLAIAPGAQKNLLVDGNTQSGSPPPREYTNSDLSFRFRRKNQDTGPFRRRQRENL